MRRLPIEVRRSEIAGLGVFATRRIASGERIIEYRGERISPSEADSRYAEVSEENALVVLFSVDDRTVIDGAVHGNDARYINHSCEPNCEAVTERRRIWIYALRDIGPREELTYDYHLIGDDDQNTRVRAYACRCGAPSCRGTMYAEQAKQPTG